MIISFYYNFFTTVQKHDIERKRMTINTIIMIQYVQAIKHKPKIHATRY